MIKLPKSLKSWVPFIFIFILSTTMMWPLFQGKVIYLADGACVFIKTIAMAEAWRHGDFVGRWTPDLIHGYGYPMFNFYSPLFFYMSSVLILLSVPAIWAFNMCIYFVFVVSGITMYLFAREIWGRQGGLLAAVAYLTAPYHLMDLYSRGALSEFTAFVFFPLIMLSIHRIMQKIQLKDVLIGMASAGALIISHNIAALLFCTTSFAYLVYLFVTDPKRQFSKLMASLSIFVVGACLSMYFWLPALMEKKYVQIERLLGGIYDYHHNFTNIAQLIFPTGPKPGDKIGSIHLVLGLVIVLCWFKLARVFKEGARQAGFFFMVTFVSILLTLPLSEVIWKNVPLLSFTEFPLRLLMCNAAGIALLIGGFVFLFKEEQRAWVMWITSAIFIGTSALLWHPLGYQDIPYTTPYEYLRSSFPMDDMEYLPKSVHQFVFSAPIPKLQALSGPIDIAVSQEKYLDESFQVSANTPGVLCYHTYNFPGWEVAVNKKIVPVVDNPLGLIVFAVPEGTSQVRVHFSSTPIRQLAGNVSFLVAVIFIFSLLLYIPLKRLFP